ncbi:MAG: response regulator [Bermanella sp.]
MSLDNPLVLVVDPDPIHQEILDSMLGGSMTLILANSAKEALELFDFKHPELVLLEVDIPDINGYELCKQIRERSGETDCAIIFLAEAMSLEDKMVGYRYGCDDFITKPFQPEEVASKAKRTLEIKKVQKKILKESSDAMHTALIAMKQSSDMGLILRFMEGNSTCRGFDSLGQSLIELLENFSLDGRLIFKVKPRNIFVGHAADKLDVDKFKLCFDQERFIGKGKQMVVNQKNVSLIISNMPIENLQNYSELKDILGMLMNSLEARTQSIIMDLELMDDQAIGLENMLKKCNQRMSKVSTTVAGHHDGQSIITETLVHEIKDICASLSLSDNQETSFLDIFDGALGKLADSYSHILHIESDLKMFKDELTSLIDKVRQK